MSAGTYHIEIEQGATFKLGLVWKDEGGTPKDLTSYTAQMQMRSSVADDVKILDLSTAGGEITLGGAAGTIDIVVSSAVTEAITATKGVYDLELIEPDGEVVRFIEGKVKVSKEVTRD